MKNSLSAVAAGAGPGPGVGRGISQEHGALATPLETAEHDSLEIAHDSLRAERDSLEISHDSPRTFDDSLTIACLQSLLEQDLGLASGGASRGSMGHSRPHSRQSLTLPSALPSDDDSSDEVCTLHPSNVNLAPGTPHFSPKVADSWYK